MINIKTQNDSLIRFTQYESNLKKLLCNCQSYQNKTGLVFNNYFQSKTKITTFVKVKGH